jgi:RNA polymerase sigma factor (sigma-70 family)
MLKLWKPIPGQTPSTHEDTFVEHYKHLLEWALRLTNGDRERAEDLVQDAFVQFTFVRPDLASIRNPEAYLYGMLRNLHLMDLRRATHHRTESLSLIDYDSAELGLKSRDLSLAVQTRDELALICQYACRRKQSSKAGSVLILRFFHGYYPSEIALVIQSSRPVVSELLKVARNEVRQFVERPESLTFMQNEGEASRMEFESGLGHDQLLIALRATIFKTRTGNCLSSRSLKSLYALRQPLDGPVLDHLVSCPKCLDGVNKLLGLPLLAERFPTDMLSPDKSDKSGGGGGAAPPGDGSPGEVIKKCRRRAKGVFEHRPRELCVSVNGDVQVWQTVTAEITEQTVSLEVAEEVNLVEVSSEQGVRLILLEVDTPIAGPVEQSAGVELSEGRLLQVSLDHSALRPRLHMVYRDPEFNESVQEKVQSPKSKVQSPKAEVQSPMSNVQVSPRKTKNFGHWTLDIGHWTTNIGRFWKAGTVTALIALALIGSLLILSKRGSAPTRAVADLLDRSTAAEEAFLARTDTVLHRTINLEERIVGQSAGAVSDGQLVTRRRIEIWHSAEKGISARRLYDDQNRLVAGDWRRSDGVQTLYHHGARPRIQLAPNKNEVTAVSLDIIWVRDVSAKEFGQLIDNAQSTRLEELASTYLISYTGNANSANGLVRASLVLSKPDLHATELVLVVKNDGSRVSGQGPAAGSDQRQDSSRQSIGNQQFLEYRFVEVSFERHSPSTVAPSVFEPEPELLGSDTGTRRNGPTENVPGSPRLPISPSPITASPELEVEVLTLLRQAGADLGEQINVTRTADGALYIKGLVDTDQRKMDILRALESVRSNPAVKIDLSTAAEALARHKRQSTSTSSSSTVEQVESADSRIPVYGDLHRYLSARGVPEGDIDAESSRVAIRVSAYARQALQHAWALKRLAERFSLEDLRSLDPQAKQRWLALVREHANAIKRDDSQLRLELQAIFQAAGVARTGEADLSSDAALLQSIQRLFDLCVVNDRVIRVAFTVSADPTKGAAVRSLEFWNSLVEAENLAGRISKQ